MNAVASWFLLFMFYSFAGWLLEVILGMLEHKKVVNRGFLIGPICPIYGTGAIILSLLLHTNNSIPLIIIVSLVGGALLEYGASWLMEKIFRVRWWDYSNKPGNINGRICLESVIAFGIFGVLIVKVTTPFFLWTISLLPEMWLYVIAGLLVAWMVFDIILSLWLILGVRVTVGTVQKDATEEISERVQQILMNKGKLNRRLIKAFPNQIPSQKTKQSSHHKTKTGKKSPNRV